MLDKPFWKRLPGLVRAGSLALPLVAIPVLVMAAVVGPSVPVKLDNTVSSGTENVGFAGQMTISTRIIDDPDFRAPTILELIVDFSKVTGQGKATGRKFGTEAQTVIHRPLLAFDSFEMTFPYTQGNDIHSARTATVSIDVTYNARSGIGVTSKVTKTSANGSSS